MRKKSLYDIAMEQKKESLNKENNIAIKKNSKLLIIIEMVEKIIKSIIYLLICVLITVGTTVLINSGLRNELINIIKMNL